MSVIFAANVLAILANHVLGNPVRISDINPTNPSKRILQKKQMGGRPAR